VAGKYILSEDAEERTSGDGRSGKNEAFEESK